MDDYVSKPFDRQKLFTALQRNLEACGKTIRPRQTPLTPTPAQNRPENEFSEFLPALDIQEGMDRLGIDLPLYISILEEYSEQHQGIGDKLSTLLTAGDYEEASGSFTR